MRRHRGIGLLAALATLGLRPATADARGAGEPPIFHFSQGFSSTQGANHWYYKEWDGTAYTDMEWAADANRWRGRGKYCQVWNEGAHPDETEAVIAWKAPIDGEVHIQGMIERPNAAGDGTRARILRNAGRIWPSADWQDVYPSFTVQHSLVTPVRAGDWIYFHVNRVGDVGFDDTLWTPTIHYNGRPGFVLDGARYVMAESDLRRVGIHTMDASLSMLPTGRGREFAWFHSEEQGTRHQLFLGSLERPAHQPVFVKDASQFFVANPSRADGKWWLTNFYRHTDGSLLGFIHVEGSGNGKKFRLGLAYSIDHGMNWGYLGHIIQQHGDPDDLNITGTPYVVKDGSFHVYYTDDGGPCVARAPLAAVMDAARRGKLTPWSKYFQGRFDEPGWGGRASGIGAENHWLHGDAAFSTTKKKYILAGYNHSPGRGVWVAFSEDGLSWTKGDWLQHGRDDNKTLSPYITIVALDGTDNALVEDSFYAYWGYNPDWETTRNRGIQYVVRQKVTLVAP